MARGMVGDFWSEDKACWTWKGNSTGLFGPVRWGEGVPISSEPCYLLTRVSTFCIPILVLGYGVGLSGGCSGGSSCGDITGGQSA